MAWQPFTPRGVAAFAHATGTRLFVVQWLVALLVALTCVWFFASQWFPVIQEAIQHLPSGTAVRAGVVQTSIDAPLRLAENDRLAIVLDAGARRATSRVADLEITLEQKCIAACGLLGCLRVSYSPKYIISLNREAAAPWWGAWHGPILWIVGFAVIATLLASWWIIGLVAAPLVRLVAFFADRCATLGGSFRLAMAALLPGAMVVVIALGLYATGAIDPLRLLLGYAIHLVCGVVFMLVSPLFLPRSGRTRDGNPFSSRRAETARRARESDNPFSKDQK